MYKVSVVTPFHNVDMGMFSKCASGMRSQTLGFKNVEWIIVVHNSDTDYGRAYGFEGIETLADYQRQVPLTDYDVYRPLINLQTNIGENGILTAELTRYYLENTKGERIPCTEKHVIPYAEAFATTLKGHHNLLVALVGPRSKQTNDGCTIETLESINLLLRTVPDSTALSPRTGCALRTYNWTARCSNS